MSKFNLETETIKNTNYRKVIETTKNIQLVLMSLKPMEDIPAEVHKGTTQFFRVEQGTLAITVNGVKKIVKDGQSLIVLPGKRHYVQCIGSKPAKLYTIYSPPEHPDGLVQKYKPTN
jgi:hypothetical protein